MGRPKAVNIKTFSDYNLLHTEKTKMMSGVHMTTLYPIKETEQYFQSIEVWAYCASKFRRKKKNCTLSVNIPTLTDEKTIAFLNEEAWHDWTEKEKDSSEMMETLEMLNKLFPNHKKVYFYELSSILSAYNHGTFRRYDNEGNIAEPWDNDIQRRKSYTHKYNWYSGHDVPEIKEAYEAYQKGENEKDKKAKFAIYHALTTEHAYANNCLDNVFLNIGENAVCYPVAFTESTADWSKDKYGRLIGYAHAGEIFFVVTPDAVYFEVTRHF